MDIKLIGKLIAVINLIAFSMTVTYALPLDKLKYPSGFKISVYAKVPDAREMTLGKNGIVFVGSRDAGKVYAVIPNKAGTHADKVIVIASNLNMPNGVAYHNGDLYVAAVNRILRYPDIEANLQHPHAQLITDKLPSNKHHGWRYIRFSPDGWLYFAVGAPCNVCIEKDPRFATIMRMQPDGKDMQIYVSGVRNSVGFDWNPHNNGFWFTDNGRDWLGDNRPPDELNYAPQKGMNFGFPYFYGKNISDPQFGHLAPKPASFYTPATLDLDAHVAPLGMTFYTGKMFPKSYWNAIIIAEHGSWNRTTPIGYRLQIVHLDSNKPISKGIFVSGWLQGSEHWGRPVDVLVLPDGSLLVSDDYAGVIYRITYQQS